MASRKVVNKKETKPAPTTSAPPATTTLSTKEEEASEGAPDMTNPVVAFNMLASALNSANQKGAFTLAESAQTFTALNVVASYINFTIGKGGEKSD